VRVAAAAACTPLSASGKEYLPAKPNCLFVANHCSYLDSFVLAALLPYNIRFVAKAELKKIPVINVYLRRLGTEFVERFDKQKGIDDARRIATTAGDGRTILFYPEGRLSRQSGLAPFRMGAFVAAAEAGLPIVPVSIRGTRSMLRPKTRLTRRGSVAITIGDPINPNGITAEDTWNVALEMRRRSREHILRYCGEPDLGAGQTHLDAQNTRPS
jgi:1-acyl-sn-glycerol-3-phosphate acyltransferase